MSKIKTITTFIFAAFMLMVLAACGSPDPSEAIPAVEQTQFQTPPQDKRNFRYCEVIPVFRSGTTLSLEVYNSLGLNDCPAEEWGALNVEAMAEEYGAVQVLANGPRFFLVNEFIGSGAATDAKVADFGGIEMRQAAVIERELSQDTLGETSYVENEVQRVTTYIFYAGDMVYELISPDGDVYRMQSYTQQVDATLMIEDLETLGDRLDLPEGWSYQATVLSEESRLIVDGLAFVISDDFLNAYQKITEN